MRAMTGWTCPSCARLFRRRNQGHECSPAMSVEEYFASGPAHERPIFEAVMARLVGVGPVHVEPVSVGIFLKRCQSFAQLRPRDRWVNLGLTFPAEVASARLGSRMAAGAGHQHATVRLRSPDEVDDEIAALLHAAYDASPE